MNTDGCNLRDLDEMDENGWQWKCCFETAIKYKVQKQKQVKKFEFSTKLEQSKKFEQSAK